MEITALIKIIGGLSVLNTLTVEAVKKLLEKSSFEIPENILAAFSAVILSIVACIMYAVYYSAPVTSQFIVEGIIIVYLSFLCSTVTFDKVKQALKQLGG